MLPPAMPALPEAIPAPAPNRLLPAIPGNLLSGFGCQLDIMTKATAAKNEAMMIFRIETIGTDGIFVRTATSLVATSPIANEQNYLKIFQSFEIFFKYLGWIMIPNLIFFLPYGIIQYFKNRKKENNFIIIFD